MDRAAYLRRFTAEYIVKLCELNHIDTNEVKTKQERVASLCDLPHMSEDTTQSSGLGTSELMKFIQEMEHSRQSQTEKLCKSLVDAVTESAKKPPVVQLGPKLPDFHKLSSDDDITCYLATFKRLATATKKPKTEWPRLLEPYLTGKAQKVFYSLSEEDKQDFDKIVAAIERRYFRTPEAYKMEFKSDFKKGDETFEDYANRLNHNFLKWLQTDKATAEVAEVKRCFHLIMMDQFLSMVRNDSLRLKLHERKLQTVFELARAADEYLLHQRSTNALQNNSRNNPSTPPAPEKTPVSAGKPPFSVNKPPSTTTPNNSQPPARSAPQPPKAYDKPQPPNKVNFLQSDTTCGNGPLVEAAIADTHSVVALVDTGSSRSLITDEFCDELGLSPRLPDMETLIMVDGSELATLGTVETQVRVGSTDAVLRLHRVHRLPTPVLLGMDYVHKAHLTLDFANNCYWTVGSAEDHLIKFPMLGTPAPPPCRVDPAVPPDVDLPPRTSSQLDQPILTGNDLHRIDCLLNDFPNVMSDQPGRTDIAQHYIDIGDAPPQRSPPYRLSPDRRQALHEEIDSLLQSGKITPSKSPWASPVLMVPKKNGQFRFCVDYRKLNRVTKLDAYPMPTIDTILDSLHGAKIFSSLDLRSGYWQMGMAPEDAEKTAFICEEGLFHFTVLPFGVVNGPASFQRLMSEVLGDLIGRTCYVYLDDIVCYSHDVDQHLADLREVLAKLRSAGLTVNFEKCNFACSEMSYLGHVVSEDGLRPNPDKVAAIRDYPVPQTRKQLERFLGMVGWYQKFIPHLSDTADPLYQLRRKDVPWTWSPACQNAFDSLRHALTTQPILGFSDPDLPFSIHTDASNVGLGAILLQSQENGPRTIAFASRALSSAERNYSATEKECLAVVWALEKWRPYLEGRHCRVVTDHQALCWLFRRSHQKGRLARWVLRLQDFTFDVVYRPGPLNVVPDALSRVPSCRWSGTSEPPTTSDTAPDTPSANAYVSR
ncbi:uncharacterized protein LOC119733697 [Patiria miniata]|uniref:RNA-directed DNA polymerase n=1 Tax=Patiria miniata TaxID=46514 RepID=A0A914AH15_PATMI|nr:uncharacterized protein LOC119733697 [Patiria miniata]